MSLWENLETRGPHSLTRAHGLQVGWAPNRCPVASRLAATNMIGRGRCFVRLSESRDPALSVGHRPLEALAGKAQTKPRQSVSNALHLQRRHQSQQAGSPPLGTSPTNICQNHLHCGSRPPAGAMNSVNFGQGTSLAGWATLLCLLVGATAACLWLRFPLARSKQALSPSATLSASMLRLCLASKGFS